MSNAERQERMKALEGISRRLDEIERQLRLLGSSWNPHALHRDTWNGIARTLLLRIVEKWEEVGCPAVTTDAPIELTRDGLDRGLDDREIAALHWAWSERNPTVLDVFESWGIQWGLSVVIRET